CSFPTRRSSDLIHRRVRWPGRGFVITQTPAFDFWIEFGMIGGDQLTDFKSRKPLCAAQMKDAALADNLPNRARGHLRWNRAAKLILEQNQRLPCRKRFAHFFIKRTVAGW